MRPNGDKRARRITAHHENQRNQRFRQLSLDNHYICSNITNKRRSETSDQRHEKRRIAASQRRACTPLVGADKHN